MDRRSCYFVRWCLAIWAVVLSVVASAGEAQENSSCHRLVSLSPSITEVLYALGMGDDVVGVTRYCLYPPQAQTKPKVGGFIDISFESIVALRPDYVLGTEELSEKLEQIERLGIKTIKVEHRSVGGILNSIETIGNLCGHQFESQKLISGIRKDIDFIKGKVKGLRPTRTLVVVGDSGDGSGLNNLFVSGGDGYYNELLSIAGGVNVYQKKTISVPTLSIEGLVSLNPDVIIEVSEGGRDVGSLLEKWKSLSGVRAVQNSRVYVLQGDYIVIPGPRFVRTLREFLRILHPEVTLDEK